jgi:hypothetical protein
LAWYCCDSCRIECRRGPGHCETTTRLPKTRHSWAWVGDFDMVAARPLPFSDRPAERTARLPMGRSVGWALWKGGLRSTIGRQPAVVHFSANFGSSHNFKERNNGDVWGGITAATRGILKQWDVCVNDAGRRTGNLGIGRLGSQEPQRHATDHVQWHDTCNSGALQCRGAQLGLHPCIFGPPAAALIKSVHYFPRTWDEG